MESETRSTRLDVLEEHLRDQLQVLYGARLRSAILFGSYARGEAGPESDLDVLVVLKGPVDRYAEYRRLGDLTVAFMERFGIYVSPVVASEEQYREGDGPLLRSIREEGITL